MFQLCWLQSGSSHSKMDSLKRSQVTCSGERAIRLLYTVHYCSFQIISQPRITNSFSVDTSRCVPWLQTPLVTNGALVAWWKRFRCDRKHFHQVLGVTCSHCDRLPIPNHCWITFLSHDLNLFECLCIASLKKNGRSRWTTARWG